MIYSFLHRRALRFAMVALAAAALVGLEFLPLNTWVPPQPAMGQGTAPSPGGLLGAPLVTTVTTPPPGVTIPPTGTGGLFNVGTATGGIPGVVTTAVGGGASVSLSVASPVPTDVRIQALAVTPTGTTISVQTVDPITGAPVTLSSVPMTVTPPPGVDPNTFTVTIQTSTGTQTFSVANGTATVNAQGQIEFTIAAT